MREIKFRAWDVSSSTMDYELTRLDFRAGYRQHEPAAFDETGVQIPSFHLMQFTGLHVNGKDVYEGDVVVCQGGYDYPEGQSGCEDPCVVKFEEGQWVCECPSCGEVTPLYEYDLRDVIGNIYENPELLAN
jgi:uncharacterized phage protein (TIGR01671 family)